VIRLARRESCACASLQTIDACKQAGMTVHNADVAWMFNRLADLLELDGANPFRVRAYRDAARIVDGAVGGECSDRKTKRSRKSSCCSRPSRIMSKRGGSRRMSLPILGRAKRGSWGDREA
jgi:Helix-hairpin-helix domain